MIIDDFGTWPDIFVSVIARHELEDEWEKRISNKVQNH
jgi:hypothetical protein